MISHYIRRVYLINQMFNKMMDQIFKNNKLILILPKHKYNIMMLDLLIIQKDIFNLS